MVMRRRASLIDGDAVWDTAKREVEMANQKGQMLRSLGSAPSLNYEPLNPQRLIFSKSSKSSNSSIFGVNVVICCDPNTSRPSSFDPFEGVTRTRASADGRVVQLSAFENQNHIQER